MSSLLLLSPVSNHLHVRNISSYVQGGQDTTFTVPSGSRLQALKTRPQAALHASRGSDTSNAPYSHVERPDQGSYTAGRVTAPSPSDTGMHQTIRFKHPRNNHCGSQNTFVSPAFEENDFNGLALTKDWRFIAGHIMSIIGYTANQSTHLEQRKRNESGCRQAYPTYSHHVPSQQNGAATGEGNMEYASSADRNADRHQQPHFPHRVSSSRLRFYRIPVHHHHVRVV